MTMLQQFLATFYILVINGRWSELADYISLIKEIKDRPTAVLTVGKPTDKEIKTNG